MLIYILLIILILLLPAIISPFVGKDREKIQFYTALFGTLAIFLILALKAPSVGVDIKGYEQQYMLSKRIAWDNYSYVYFENGYIFLEKLFSKTGLPFQAFISIAYFVECLALFLVIRKFSKDARLSLIVFVCYQFFVFSTSGLRQTIALSLCLYSFLLIYKRRIWLFAIGIVLIILANTIHSSAVLFFVVPIVMVISRYSQSVTWVEFFIGIVVSILLRGALWNFVSQNVRKMDSGSVDFGGNMLLLAGLAVFFLFTYQYYYGIGFIGGQNISVYRLERYPDYDDTILVRVSFCAFFFYIMLSGGVMLRGLMYINVLLVPLFSNLIQKYEYKQRFAIKALMSVLFISIFLFQTLIPNQLEICPYVFFWQAE